MNQPHGALEDVGLAPESSALEGTQYGGSGGGLEPQTRKGTRRCRVLFFQATDVLRRARCRLIAALAQTISIPSVIAEKT